MSERDLIAENTELVRKIAGGVGMRTVTFDELEPGMLLDSYELVVSTMLKGSLFSGRPSLRSFDLNDGYYGSSICEIRPETTFNILHEQGTKEYQKAVNKLLEERFKYIRDSEKDCEILRGFLDVAPRQR